jgi:hypothetical protein
VLLSKTDDGEVQRCRGFERRDEVGGGVCGIPINRVFARDGSFFFYNALEPIMRRRVAL